MIREYKYFERSIAGLLVFLYRCCYYYYYKRSVNNFKGHFFSKNSCSLNEHINGIIKIKAREVIVEGGKKEIRYVIVRCVYVLRYFHRNEFAIRKRRCELRKKEKRNET